MHPTSAHMAATCFGLLLATCLFVSASQLDNDLVFDDALRKGQSRAPAATAEPPHQPSVAPIDAPLEDDAPLLQDEGLLTSLARKVRSVFSLWKPPDKTQDRNKRQERADLLPIDSEDDLLEARDEEADEDDENSVEPRREAGSARYTDDEDDADAAHSGSGHRGGPTLFSSRRIYRVGLSVQEPYRTEFKQRESEQYRSLESNLVEAMNELFHPRRVDTTLISVESTLDSFIIRVRFDIGTNQIDGRTIESKLRNQVRLHRLGKLQVKPDNFVFNKFEGESSCEAGRLPCRSGECLDASARCNGIEECVDGSDELGCPFSVHPDIDRSLVTARIPTSDSQDRCRADDKLLCKDGVTYICTVQKCDGESNCPGGDDEEGCPSLTPLKCIEGEFMCDITRCISSSQVCDKQQDCDDETDEQNCQEGCGEGQFLCDGSRCISRTQVCDRHPDCADRSDETNCPRDPPECAQDEFQCKDRCIEGFRRCDYATDCPDGEDEENCSSCPESQFTCNDGTCVPLSDRCNGEEDCADSSDELGCPAACSRDQWQCNDGQCIDRRQHCDGKVDCRGDDSDERDCEENGRCLPGQFRCSRGRCIADSERCDKKYDCGTDDFSDELNCPCRADDFVCNNGFCIPGLRKCNGIHDCQDGSDEDYCHANCSGGDFQCGDGSCVPFSARCDRQYDCRDGSDEQGCSGQHCRNEEFTCNDGQCVNINARCDGKNDCREGEDEHGCSGVTECRPGEFRCHNGHQCISSRQQCDGRVDCRDGSDEFSCSGDSSRPYTCSPSEFTCRNGQCIPASKHCDKYFDCSDDSDERDCEIACSKDEFKCGNGLCITIGYVCDKHVDCLDGSDEANCGALGCETNEFSCHDGSGCIPTSLVCDRHDDCFDGSDEDNCPTSAPQTCASNEFTCPDGSCIDRLRVCDRRPDCGDGSDERNCGCRADQFQCSSGECIPLYLRCNNAYDCRDASDERGCPPYVPPTTRPPFQCPPGQFTCRTGEQCVPQSAVCNKRYECQDFSDESNCTAYPGGLNLKTYPEDQIIKESREVVFQCRDEGPLRARVHWIRGNGLPLPPGSRDYNGRLEIPDIQVEHSGTYICEAVGYPLSTPGSRVSVHLTVEKMDPPSTRPPKACGLNEATCSNQECIAKSLVCDGKFDCTDGSDETHCSPHGCEPNQFRCSNKKCVMKTWLCDSDDDCGDGSDEANCATNPPGSPCRYNEFECKSRNQCIPKSFHCDLEVDCIDRSDEEGCSPVHIVIPPPPLVELDVGSRFEVTCTTVGVPTPEVVWRLNWGHIPDKCTTTSSGGVGKLTCPDVQENDQGAYSCEAINTRGSTFAVPDTILVVRRPKTVCTDGYFNDLAYNPSDCISCFCFGVTSSCKSADLFTYQLPPPFTQYNLVGVRADRSGNLDISPDLIRTARPNIRPLGSNGIQVYPSDSYRPVPGVYPYFAMPENYHGNQLKSYGGYLKYTLRFEGQGQPINSPDIILSGNGFTLVHSGQRLQPGRDNEVSVRFFYGEWYKSGTGRPGGDIPSSSPGDLASREEIMMALANVDNILIKAQYHDGSNLDTTLKDIRMDSAGIRNTGQGQAAFVEECRCPPGYSGLSCENCAPGYSRRRNGPWLGICIRNEAACQPGTYGDPSRGIPCQPCPCPLTDPRNQFGRTCILDTDGQVTCNCPQGYVGRRCERCDTGYRGNPLIPGDSCIPGRQCDPAGSESPSPDPVTGRCSCKEFATGALCNQCKANTFHLDPRNQLGCINCFCMGIITQCASSTWYRQQVSTSFTRQPQGFTIVEGTRREEPIRDGLRVDPSSRELIFEDFARGTPDVYYWMLPSQYVGNKVTSYGGYLNYTVRYVPTPGGQSSRNSAADVELISSNDIHLLYYSREQIEPDRPQTITVPFFEQYWQRHDGQVANREHLLMALADLQAILIKATYTTNTREAALQQVSMDIAEERNTGQPRALEVEQCQCPPGYRGLSCEDCDAGYTRGDDGLYLGFCIPCNCNGHSEECDPETGDCFNCRDHTSGPNCESCDRNYERNPETDRCEVSGEPVTDCDCDARGSQRLDCPRNQCICKKNVEGYRCDRCRQGTFDLSASHVEGCLECFCSGVTPTNCQSANLYREQIPMQIIDRNHGFTITDSNRNTVVTDNFILNTGENEIGYDVQSRRDQRLFWSLPPAFTGNKLNSYGGNLTITQQYTARPGSTTTPDSDIIIIGNDITIYWSGVNIEPGKRVTYSVPLREGSWQRLVRTGPRPASRQDILTVLSNIEAIQVRAFHGTQTLTTLLSDVYLDTAVPQNTGQGLVTDIELCRCPIGYRGSSCEACATGYYRQPGSQTCQLCPCNKNEESCDVSYDGRVTCNCRPGFTGRYCDSTESPSYSTERPTRPPPPSPTIIVTIQEPAIRIVDAGSVVTFVCSGRSVSSTRPVSLSWSKEGGDLPRDRAYDDRRGILTIQNAQLSDSGTYICTATDDSSVSTVTAVLTVGGSGFEIPQVTIRPRYLDLSEGETAEFNCEASGNPAPNIHWTLDEGRSLPPRVSYSRGILRFPSVRKSDEGIYYCHAINAAGNSSEATTLYVRERPEPPGPVYPPVSISVEPSDFSGAEGETVQLTCRVQNPREFNLQWSRSGGRPLPSSASQRDGVLTIYNPTQYDSDIYVCTAVSTYTGESEQAQARVTITTSRTPPSIRIDPERQTVSQGSVAELRCIATGDPAPIIEWSKVNENLPSNVQVQGSTLKIINALVRDRGVYVCTAKSSAGQSQSSAIIEVERREVPTIELYPKDETQKLLVGGSTLMQCRVTGGIPSPQIKWIRQDRRPMSTAVEEIPGGVLRFTQVTEDDEGVYECSATNDAGIATLSASLVIQEAPRITLQPGTEVTVKLGESVRLECRASGDPAPQVSWVVPDRGQIYPASADRSGLSVAIHEITSVRRSDEGSYTCLAQNEAGATEDRLQLIIIDGPGRGDIPSTSNWQPTPYYPPRPTPYPPSRDTFTVPRGGRAELVCRVAERNERIYLEWFRNDRRPLPESHTMRDGVLVIYNVQPSDAGLYSCQGIGSRGTPLFTTEAQLQVIEPPHITLHPQRQIVRPGDDARITCSVTGEQPITIQWGAQDRSLPPSVTTYDGILQFRGIRVSDAGRYVCNASNPSGNAQAAAEVIVDDQSYQPSGPRTGRDQTAYVGSDVELRCQTPVPGNYMSWSRDRDRLPNNARQQNDILYLTDVRASDEGRYICHVIHEDGSESSQYIDLRIEKVVGVCRWNEFRCRSGQCLSSRLKCDGIEQCYDGSDEANCYDRKGRGIENLRLNIDMSPSVVRIGDTVDLRCTASGNTRPIFSWSKDGERLGANTQTSGDLLRITNVQLRDGGVYKCTARTSTGIYDERHLLTIQDISDISDAAAVETRMAPYGSTVVMDCRTDLDPPVNYRWTKQGGELPGNTRSDDAQLILPDVRAKDAGTYVCTAQNREVKMDIPTVLVVTGVVPHFAQAPSSYMEFPSLSNAYLNFTIEISFKPEQPNGLLLYNGEQKDVPSDFISLGLNDSRVEFRFNVGSGPATIIAPNPIRLGEWHTVKVERQKKIGRMYVDDDGPFIGEAPGTFQGLDLAEPMYIGGVPNFRAIHRQSGFRSGFVGCISQLILGGIAVELVQDAKHSQGVSACSTCEENPCQNDGVCQESSNSKGYSCICPPGYNGQNCERLGQSCYPGVCGNGRCVIHEGAIKCYCPFGKAGPHCEKDIDIKEMFFSEDAYVAYPTPKSIHRSNIAFRFKPRDVRDSVLAYSSQNEDGKGDFISLIIHNKSVEFRFDTGYGPTVIRSRRTIQPGRWHAVTARRHFRNGTLSVDGEDPVKGESNGKGRSLTLKTPLFIGGYDQHRITLSRKVGVKSGYQGCIANVDFASQFYLSVVDSANVEECTDEVEPSPCDSNPCKNGGSCSALAGEQYICSCTPGFTGQNCQVEVDICEALSPCQNGGTCSGSGRSYKCLCPLGFAGQDCQQGVDFSSEVSFYGDGYVELPKSLLPHTTSDESEVITIEFSTTEPNGLIFWHGQTTDTYGRGQDYLSLAVVNGTLEFSFELGSGPAVIPIRSIRVDDGVRHRAILKRQGTDGSLNLDNIEDEFGESAGVLGSLNTAGSIYIGGLPDIPYMTGQKHATAFTGCVHSVQLQQSGIINLRERALSGVNAVPCSSVSYDVDNEVRG